MVKPLHITVVFNVMKEFILWRNPMNVVNVEKSFHITVVFIFILQRNTNAVNVVKPLHVTVVFTFLKEFILERNPIISQSSANS